MAWDIEFDNGKFKRIGDVKMKTLRKIFTVVLAVAMVMSLNTMAFAVGPIDTYRCSHESDACYQMVLNCEKHVHDSNCEEGCQLGVKDEICGLPVHDHVAAGIVRHR